MASMFDSFLLSLLARKQPPAEAPRSSPPDAFIIQGMQDWQEPAAMPPKLREVPSSTRQEYKLPLTPTPACKQRRREPASPYPTLLQHSSKQVDSKKAAQDAAELEARAAAACLAELQKLCDENSRLEAAQKVAEVRAKDAKAAQDAAELEARAANQEAFQNRQELAEMKELFCQQLHRTADLEAAYNSELDRRLAAQDRLNKSGPRNFSPDRKICRTLSDTGPGGADERELALALASHEVECLRRLPGDELINASKRVMAKWHPEKNQQNKRFASIVLQQLKCEFDGQLDREYLGLA